MAATSYGYDNTTFKARPDFNARRDAKGGWMASNSFSMLRETWENSASFLFLKGTPITDLYEELPSYWGFLLLDEVDVRNEPGGVTIVNCNWLGTNEEKEEAVYTLSGTRVDRSILQHPVFLHDFDGKRMGEDNAAFSKAWIVAVMEGKAELVKDKTIDAQQIHYKSTVDRRQPDYAEHHPDAVKWGRMIFVEGHRTFKAPTLQWTEELTSVDGWVDKDLNHLGLVEYSDDPRPPGYPPMPMLGHTYEWMKISMSQDTTGGLTNQSQTWELSPPLGFPKFPDGPDGPHPINKGLYEYDPNTLFFM